MSGEVLPDFQVMIVGCVAIVALLAMYLVHLRMRHQSQHALAQYEIAQLSEQLELAQSQAHDANQALAGLRQRGARMEAALAAANAKSLEQEKHYAEQISLLQDAKVGLAKEFELLASRVLQSKEEAFKRNATDQLEAVISPFKNQLVDFYQRVEHAQKEERAQHHQLVGQIVELQKQSRSIGDDAMKLANALKGGNKLQGNWGELVLERLLEMVGFTKGREYQLQASERNDDGKLQKPDVVVHLPGNRDVIIDSKVSLLAYEQFINTGEDTVHLKSHYDSVLAHIKNLSTKKYDQLGAFQTLDFVFLFIPIEPAYSVLVHHYPDILKVSYERNVLVVSPSSLVLALRAIDALWRRDVQDKNIEKLSVSAGKLYDNFVSFVETLSGVGVQLDKAVETYNQSFKKLSEGRGNLVKRAEELRKLGARTSKKLPAELVDKDAMQDETKLNESDSEVLSE